MFQRSIRTTAGIALLAVVAIAAAACGGSSAGSAGGSVGSVVFTGYGGSGQAAQTQAWLNPFSKSTGIKVVQDYPTDYSKMQTMEEAKHVTWDVVDGGADYPGGVVSNPQLAKLNCSVVECSDFATGPAKLYPQAVPAYIWSYVLAYNTTDFAANPPKGVDALWDTKDYPGKRIVEGDWGFEGLLESALIHSGVPRDKLYPLDVTRALKALDPIKSDLIFYTDPQECINDVASGNAVMGYCYNGRVTLAHDQGEPISIAWGQQMQLTEYYNIMANSPDPANAQKLVAYITSAAHNGDYSNYIPYAPANPKANAHGKYAADVPTAHDLTGSEAPLFLDNAWWTANITKTITEVTNWQGS